MPPLLPIQDPKPSPSLSQPPQVACVRLPGPSPALRPPTPSQRFAAPELRRSCPPPRFRVKSRLCLTQFRPFPGGTPSPPTFPSSFRFRTPASPLPKARSRPAPASPGGDCCSRTSHIRSRCRRGDRAPGLPRSSAVSGREGAFVLRPFNT